MKVQDYISSGILELYVAGTLSHNEMRDVERYAEQYPEIRSELVRIEHAIEQYTLVHAVPPRPELKQSLMDKISAETEKAITTHAEVLEMQPKPKTRPVSFYLAAASIVLMLASLGAAGFFFMQWKKSEEKLATLEDERAKLTQNVVLVQNNARDMARNMSRDLEILLSRNTRTIPVRGTKLAPKAMVMVYWNAATKDVYLNVEQLPPAPSGMQYQLWTLKDGKPVNAGLIDLDPKGIKKMEPTDRSQAFMVTLETQGGSAVPTKERLYLSSGKI